MIQNFGMKFKSSWRNSFRYLLYLVVLGVIVWFIHQNWQEVSRVTEVMGQGLWYWLVCATVFQVFRFMAQALAIKASFKAIQVDRRGRELLAVGLSALTVSVIAPVANFLYYIDDARRRGHPSIGSLYSIGVAVMVEWLMVALLSGLVVIFLASGGSVGTFLGVGALTLASFGLFIAISVVVAWYQPKSLGWIIGRFGRFADDWQDEWKVLSKKRPALKPLGATLFWHFLGHLAGFMSLVCVFLAFDLSLQLPALAFAYCASVVFLVLSPTPMGIGVVEGAITLVLVTSNYPVALATALALAFRGVSFWLPFLVGIILLHRLQKDRLILQESL